MEQTILSDFPSYSITNSGIIINNITNKIIKGTQGRDGYHNVKLFNKLGERKSLKLHRLVASTFLVNPENKPTVDHIDRDKTNNNFTNLRWATYSEQSKNKKHPINQRETINRPVNRIDKKTNKIIETYESLREANEWLLKQNITKNKNAVCAISTVCNMKKNTAYGFKWRFKDEMSIDNEIWIDLQPELVNGVKGYKISTLGRVKGRTGRINTGWDNSGYTHVSVGKKSYQLHRLVASSFKKTNEKEKNQVNHKDGNKKNNSLDNLEWVTHKENIQHAFDTGLSPTRPVIQYDLTGKKIRSYHSIAEAEKELNLENSHISKAIDKEKRAHGFIWTSIEVNNAIPKKITLSTTSKKPHKKIIQYKSNGITFIREFDSAKEVSECFNVAVTSVNHWCTGHRNSYTGFIFKYKNDL
jgi:hypothetical protein